MMLAATLALVPATVVRAEAPGEAMTSASLTLEISGLDPVQGSVMIGIYGSEAGWDDGRAVSGARVDVTSGTAIAVIENLPTGLYGVKMYHDVNANGEMDTNLVGIPSEPFAFSNNARGRFGPPRWEAAVFEVSAEGTVHGIRFE